MVSASDTGELLADGTWQGRAILLVDLDAFFASVEQLDHPGWRGKPVIVGGDSGRRGVVSTASYEARTYGVHSAMPSSTAARLCPDAIWTEGHFDRYREMSDAVMAILHDETPLVQQVSIDEAFLDVTPNEVNREHPVSIARRIQERVDELGISCSIGIGTTKAIAKLASDMDKPHGITVVFPGSERSFMDPQPIRSLSGIGASTEKKLLQLGIETLGDLARADETLIDNVLGKNGRTMQQRARGTEVAPVEKDDEVKSVSNEISFAQDVDDRDELNAAIATMASKVGRRLRRKSLKGKTIALKVRYSNRSVRSVQRPLPEPCDDESVFIPILSDMLNELWHESVPLRLVGVAITGFDSDELLGAQLSLFDRDADQSDKPESKSRKPDSRLKSLAEATDRVRDKFGEHAIAYGREIRTWSNTTGSSSKNPADYK